MAWRQRGFAHGDNDWSGPGDYDYERRRTVIRCPWHGFEYRLDSGQSLVQPERLRLKTYRVEIEDSDVVLYA